MGTGAHYANTDEAEKTAFESQQQRHKKRAGKAPRQAHCTSDSSPYEGKSTFYQGDDQGIGQAEGG